MNKYKFVFAAFYFPGKRGETAFSVAHWLTGFLTLLCGM